MTDEVSILMILFGSGVIVGVIGLVVSAVNRRAARELRRPGGRYL